MFDLMKIELPDCGNIPEQVTELWRDLFGDEEVISTRSQFRGDERDFFHDTLYAAVKDGKLAACCHITRQKNGYIAGLGGVASAPEFRGQGAADKVMAFALDDFDRSGCDAIFLGTGNPVAANLYSKYGFAYVRGTSAMLRVTGGLRPMDIFPRELAVNENVTVEKGDASFRLPVIPLVYDGCGMLVCDAAAGIYGVRTFVQWSCMGLYPRYEKIREKGGDFLLLKSGTHCVGVASFVPSDCGADRVHGDLYYTSDAAEYAPELLKKLQTAAGGRELMFTVSPVDAAKYNLLISCGAVYENCGRLFPAKGVELAVDHLVLK